MTIRLLFLLLVYIPLFVPAKESHDWHLPDLRSAHRAGFRISRDLRTDGPTTSTLLAMRQTAPKSTAHALAVHAASMENLSSPTLTLARQNALRASFLELLDDGEIRWGPQTLWNVVINPPMRRPGEFPEYLLDQLEDDNTRWNGHVASELYVVGLSEDPERFLPPLVARWETIRRNRDGTCQAGALVGSLLLTVATKHAESLGEGMYSWYTLSFGGWYDDPIKLARFDARTQRVILDVCAVWGRKDNRWSPPGEVEDVAIGNRRMAWYILETTEPLAVEQLRSLASGSFHSGDRLRVAALWLLRDPASLALPANRDILLDSLVGSWWWPPDILEILLTGDPQDEALLEYLHDEVSDIMFSDPVQFHGGIERVIPNRAALLSVVRDALSREYEPPRQFAFSRLLLEAGDPSDHALIQQIMISNFTHDDWMQNSTSAYDHLVGFGDEAIVALNAGIKVGLEEDDWQVVDKCVSLLSWIDPEFDPGQRPELIPFMIRQLSDDDVEGNAAAGRRYLAMCGEFARPALEEVTRTGDEQAKGYAQRLLGVLEDVESWEEHHEEEAPVHSQLPLCNEAQSSETFALDR